MTVKKPIKKGKTVKAENIKIKLLNIVKTENIAKAANYTKNINTQK